MEEKIIQTNSGIMINVDMNVENPTYVKKIVWNPATCRSEKWKIFSSILMIRWLRVTKL